MSSFLQKSLPPHLNSKLTLKLTLFSMARFCVHSDLEYGCHLLPVHRIKEVSGWVGGGQEGRKKHLQRANDLLCVRLEFSEHQSCASRTKTPVCPRPHQAPAHQIRPALCAIQPPSLREVLKVKLKEQIKEAERSKSLGKHTVRRALHICVFGVIVVQK